MFPMAFIFVACLFSILMSWSHPVYSESAGQILPSVTIVYSNGVKIMVEDWAFRYEFGETDSERLPDDRTLRVKVSKDLHLEERTFTNYQISVRKVYIAGNKISKIRFVYPETKHDPRSPRRPFRGIEIIMKDGSRESIIKEAFRPSGSFLSEKKTVFSRELYLIGKVRRDKGFEDFRLSLESFLDLPLHTISDPKERVNEIWFELQSPDLH